MKKAVICLATTETQAHAIADDLRSAGFSKNDISVLLPDRKGTRGFLHEHHTKAPEGATAGAGTGVVLGGALGWVAGIGLLAIPGVGPFIAAGPVVAMLSGAAMGGAAGGIGGALIGLGIPEFEAKRYEGKIRSGGILISVHTESAQDRERATEIFRRDGAHDISTTYEGKTKTPAYERPVVMYRDTPSGRITR